MSENAERDDTVRVHHFWLGDSLLESRVYVDEEQLWEEYGEIKDEDWFDGTSLTPWKVVQGLDKTPDEDATMQIELKSDSELQDLSEDELLTYIGRLERLRKQIAENESKAVEVAEEQG